MSASAVVRVLGGLLALWLFGCNGADSASFAGAGGTAAGTGGSGGEAGNGGGVTSCWDLDPVAWENPVSIDLTPLSGEREADPMLSIDGLSLLFTSHVTPSAPSRIYQADRAGVDEPFTGGQQLGTWVGIEPVARPWLTSKILFLSLDHGAGMFTVAEAVHDGSAWGFPNELGTEINEPSAHADSDPSATFDGRRLVFTRSQGANVFDFTLYEAVRIQGVAGEPFGSVAPLVLKPIRDTDLTMCGTLSPDGLQLFFSSTYPVDLSGGVPPGSLRVWHTRRDDLDAPWQEPSHVAALDSATHLSCMATLSGDGCEIWVERFIVGMPDAHEFVKARRTP